MEGAQADFFLSKAFSPALIAGRGYGKTIAFSAKAYTYAVNNPKGRGVLTQPSFDMIRRNFMPVWDAQFGEQMGKGWEYRIYQQGTPQEIAFQNGFIYDLRPATNEMAEKFRGATYCVAGMDELRNEDQLACYLALFGAVRAPGFPLQFFVTSTPEARRPWIRQIWTDHVDPISCEPLPSGDYPKFLARMEDNWHLTEAQKKRLRTMYGGQSRYARQELDAEDVALEGVAFEEFGVLHNRRPSEDEVFQRTVYGIDFGATSPTAMYEMKLDLSGRVWFTREFYKRNADDYDWITTVKEWGHNPVFCDPSRSEKEMEELRRRYGVTLKRSTAKRFDERVRLWRNRLTLRDSVPNIFIDFGACPNLVSEINNLAFDSPRVGEYAIDRWEKGLNDHGFDAGAYGLSAFDRALPDYNYRPNLVISRDW
jgi:hypothetical protein